MRLTSTAMDSESKVIHSQIVRLLANLGSGTIAIASLFATSPAIADELPSPTGRPILTISGDIEHTNDGESAIFDRELFESIGTTTLVTTTDWTDEATEFEGVLGRDLLDYVGAEGDVISVIALNDYKVYIPVSDFENYDVLLATTQDGEQLTPRDRGPIWIVYPRDDHPELNTSEMNDRWVWQLKAIELQ